MNIKEKVVGDFIIENNDGPPGGGKKGGEDMKSRIRITGIVLTLFLFVLFSMAASSHAATPQIAAGHAHSLALKSDGTVVAWGCGSAPIDDGQCNVPSGLSGVTAISAGSIHSLALKSDGTMAAWGDDTYGQSTVPSSLSGVIAISAGGYFSLALKSDRTVVAWGRNDTGQLNIPSGLSEVIAISAGDFHSLALKSDGTVVAWGWNYYGQSTVPSGLSGVTAIAAGGGHSLALKRDGTVVAWGRNDYGQSTVPSGLSGVTAIAAGFYAHSLALKSDGTVVAWGNNALGQSTVPSGLSGVTAIAAGSFHSLALKSDGTVVAWGDNAWGQCNVSAIGELRSVKISAGVGYTIGSTSDGTLWTWGANNLGQLGDGTTTNSTVPEKRGINNNWISIAAGDFHTVAIQSDGKLWAWGENVAGELGYTSTETCQGPLGSTPPCSTSPGQVGIDSDWVSIAAAGADTVALKSNGTLWAWGANDYGQLGDGTITDRHDPTQESSHSNNWVSIAAGGLNTVAIQSDGTLWSWGMNRYGQLGDGTTTNSTVPEKRGINNKWLSIAAGSEFTMAIKSDGTLWTWGRNHTGQLGHTSSDSCAPETDPCSTSPGQVGSDNKWISIAAGWSHSVALKSDGTLWAWGSNGTGQLGHTSLETCGGNPCSLSPGQVGTDTDWVSITAGPSHTMALKSDGTLWAWGSNSSGQLGDGTTTNSYGPEQICLYLFSPDNILFPYSGGSSDSHLIVYGTCSWAAEADYSWITIDSGGSGVGMNIPNNIDFTVDPNTGADRYGTITVTGRSLILNQTGVPACTYTVSPMSGTSYPSSGGSGTISVMTDPGCTWTANSSNPQILIYAGATGNGNGTVAYLVLPNNGVAIDDTLLIAGETVTFHQDSGCNYSINPILDTVPAAGESGTIAVTAGGGCAWTATSSGSWITINPPSGSAGNGTINYTVASNPTGSPARTGTITIPGGMTLTVTQAPQGLSASVDNPVSAPPGAPVWINVTITNSTGQDIQTIRPDCFNTVITVTDPANNQPLPTICRLRSAYGVPGDLITISHIAPNNTYTVKCDLSEMYDPTILAGPIVGQKTYNYSAAYVNFFDDPYYNPTTNGCIAHDPPIDTCYRVFTGVIPSNNGNVTIGGPQKQKLQAQIVFDPPYWDVAWATNGGPAISVQISSPDSSFDVNNINPSTIKLNGSVPVINGSARILGGVLVVQFNGAAAVSSLGTAVSGSIVLPTIQGNLSTPANSMIYGQGTVNLVNNTGTLIVQADLHTVGQGSKPAVNKSPIVGMETRVYDKTCVSSYGISWQNYPTIWTQTQCPAIAIDPANLVYTNAYGQAIFVLPPGNYVVIGKYTGADQPIYPGVSVGSVAAGSIVNKYLQIIKNAQNKSVPAKYSMLTGTELLIIEPEYVEWDSTQELYPFVFQSVGDWGVTAAVSPPEGFVADYKNLSTEVADALKAIQFTITDVGSKWVPTEMTYKIKHKGKTTTLKSKIGIKLTPGMAKLKGIGIYGQ